MKYLAYFLNGNIMNKQIVEELKSIGLKIYIIFGLFLLFTMYVYNKLEKSEPCYCVQVENESDFTGSDLKYTKSIMSDVVKYKECLKMDENIDDEDGKDLGKVRWISCKGQTYELCKEVGVKFSRLENK